MTKKEPAGKPMRCYLLRNNKIEGVELLSPGSDEFGLSGVDVRTALRRELEAARANCICLWRAVLRLG